MQAPRFLYEAARSCFVRDVFHYVFHAAIQDSAKHFDRVGTDAFVALQAGELPGADAILVDQRILRHASFAHGFPQSLI